MPDDKLGKLSAHRRSLAAQDAILTDAMKVQRNYEVPMPTNSSIKLIFDRIHADFPDLIPPFVHHGQPGALRSQIALAVQRIEERIAELTAIIREQENANRLRVPGAAAADRVWQRLQEGHNLNAYPAREPDEFIEKLEPWIDRTVNTLNLIFDSPWHGRKFEDCTRLSRSRITTATPMAQWESVRKHAEFGIQYLRDIREELSMAVAIDGSTRITASRIFIGHGRSNVWRELDDFISKRLGLSIEEYNREPTAGLFTAERLQEMLNVSSFALLIMTGEDEQPDGTRRPRENVVHEAGLFQGKLGFRRAIILLEDGCSTFSNIHGLTVVAFPRQQIKATFEDVRWTLEREGILKKTELET